MSRKLTPGYDLAIAGSGVAGLYGALCAAAEGRVLIVSKGPVLTSSSWLAQGGIAAANIWRSARIALRQRRREYFTDSFRRPSLAFT